MDKYKFYITDSLVRVYPANDVMFAYRKVKDQAFYRLEITNSLDFQDRIIEGDTISDFTLLRPYEDERYVTFYVYQLQSDDTYDLFISGYLDLTGEWNIDDKIITCNVISKDEYYFWDRYGDKKFNVLQFGLTAKDVIQRIDLVDTTISNCYALNDVLEIIFKNIFDDEDASVTSSFLTSATNPVTSTTSETTLIYICHKDSVTDTASEPEVLELSFDDIMSFLKIQFNLYWYVTGNTLYVENYKYFENAFSYSVARSVGTDLTDYTNNGKSYSDNFIKNKNKYHTIAESLMYEEIWKYQEYENIAFKDSQITYDVNLLENKKVEYVLQVSNDINYIIDNTDISGNGVCFLACELDGADTIIIYRDVQISINEFEIFNNFDFGTFKFTGNEIVSAIGTVGQYAHANRIRVGQDDVVVISFVITLISGTMPQLEFITSTESISAGYNSIAFTKTSAGSSSYIPKIVAAGTCNFSLIDFAVTRITNKNVVNAPMAWGDMLWKYHKRGRILSQGYMNGILTPFESALKLKQGETISSVPISTLDPYDLIRTDIGDGELLRASFNKNNVYELEVVYDT